MKTNNPIPRIGMAVLVLIIFGWLSWQSVDAVQSAIEKYKLELVVKELQEIKRELVTLNEKVERLLK